jgi:hypothetical protein
MTRKERRQQLDNQPEAHPRSPGRDNLHPQITLPFKQAQIALHRPATFSERPGEVGHGHAERSATSVGAVRQFKDLAGAAPRPIRQIAVIFNPGGGLRHIRARIPLAARAGDVRKG